MKSCVWYALIVAALVVAIVYMVSTSCSENYKYIDGDFDQPDFLTRRQCYFRRPDYGQLTYAGCRCSRVGTIMNNGGVNDDDSGLYKLPL